MPRQFFKSISPTRQHIHDMSWLRPLRGWLDHPELWAIRRRSVSPGVALGLFWMWMPIPGHSIGAALAAIKLRVHLPLAVLMTFIINPLTILPIYYAGFTLGRVLLDQPEREFTMELSWAWLATEFGQIWQPLILGCLIAGLATAALGYLLVEGLWRTRVGQYLQRRRLRREAR